MTSWLTPLITPVAVNCCVARNALPVPLGINMTVAVGGLTVSDSSPSIGGRPPMPPMPPVPVGPVGFSLVPAHPAAIKPQASVATKTDRSDKPDRKERLSACIAWLQSSVFNFTSWAKSTP